MSELTAYQIECVREYTRAIRKAERIMKEAEHDMWNTGNVQPLYDLSTKMREALYLISEEMDQYLFNELGSKRSD